MKRTNYCSLIFRRSRFKRLLAFLIFSSILAGSPGFAQQQFLTDGSSELDQMEKRISELTLGMVLLQGQSPEKLNQSDRDVLKIAIESGDYTKRYFAIMGEACDYYKSTSYGLVDVTELARANAQAQRAELEDHLAHLETALELLTPQSRNNIVNTVNDLVASGATKNTGIMDHERVAARFPDTFKENFANVCDRVEIMKAQIESGENIYGSSTITIGQD